MIMTQDQKKQEQELKDRDIQSYIRHRSGSETGIDSVVRGPSEGALEQIMCSRQSSYLPESLELPLGRSRAWSLSLSPPLLRSRPRSRSLRLRSCQLLGW